MSFRRVSLTVLSFALLASSAQAVVAGEDSTSMPGTLTGNVSFNTDYVYRGISQTSNGPAVMGALDWEFNTGFHDIAVYLGGFAANVDFPGSNANLETDFLAGARASFNDLAVDAGFTYYKYFGATDALHYDYAEFALKPSYDFGVVSLGGQLSYSPEYTGRTGDEFYVGLRGDVPLPYEFSGFASVGHQWVQDNTLAGIPDYTDWSVGFSRPVWKFNITAMYTDTDVDKEDCFAQAYGKVCDARGVVSLGFDF